MKKYDLTDNDINILKNKELFLFDLDGTLYNENKLFDGVLELLKNIKDSNKKYIFLTNNSSKSVSKYIKKLKDMGIASKKDDFFTSTQATISHIKKNFNYKNTLIYVVGTHSFKNELQKNGLNITDKIEDNISILLIGYDTELNYQKLIDASYLLTKDIAYIATNPDLVCPVNFGFVPDCGSMCNMLYNASKKNPIFIGKPQPDMIYAILEKYNYNKDKAVIIGDRLYTDIASGLNANIDTICVLSGESTIDDIKKTEFKPKYIIDDVSILNKLF